MSIPKLVSFVKSDDALGVGVSLVYFDDKFEVELKSEETFVLYNSVLDSLGISKRIIEFDSSSSSSDLHYWGSQTSTESLRTLLQSATLAHLEKRIV